MFTHSTGGNAGSLSLHTSRKSRVKHPIIRFMLQLPERRSSIELGGWMVTCNPSATMRPSRPDRFTDSLLAQGFIEPSRAEQHVFDSATNGFGAQRLSAHGGVSLQSADDGVHEFGFEIGRVRELLFGVVGRLLLERLGLQEFSHDHVVDVN